MIGQVPHEQYKANASNKVTLLCCLPPVARQVNSQARHTPSHAVDAQRSLRYHGGRAVQVRAGKTRRASLVAATRHAGKAVRRASITVGLAESTKQGTSATVSTSVRALLMLLSLSNAVRLWWWRCSAYTICAAPLRPDRVHSFAGYGNASRCMLWLAAQRRAHDFGHGRSAVGRSCAGGPVRCMRCVWHRAHRVDGTRLWALEPPGIRRTAGHNGGVADVSAGERDNQCKHRVAVGPRRH